VIAGYDEDGNGSISREELMNFVTKSAKLKRWEEERIQEVYSISIVLAEIEL
jgi:hypothetical protein